MNKEIKNLLIDLIKIQSVSSNIQALYEIIDYVEKFFQGIENIFIKKFEFNNKPSLIISNFEGKYADIILNGHLDVVPPSEKDQFNPYEKDGKLFARGAGDMKGGASIIIYLMKNLLKNGFNKKRISLILTTDEEVGGFDGVGKLVELGYGGEIALIPDGGSLNEIIHAEKGIIHLTGEFYGISAHGSRPWLGENAIDNAIKFYTLLKNYIENIKKLYYTETHRGSSVSLNVINGGSATNIIPDKVIAKFDIRFTEEFQLNPLLNIINKFLDKTNGKIIDILTGPVLYTDPQNKLVQEYYNIAKNIIGNVNLVKEHGGSDGRFFAEKGCKVILHRPTCGNIHSKRERVKLDELEIIYKCFEEFILE